MAFDLAYAVVSVLDGNRDQRDVLRKFDDNDSSDDEAPAAPLLDAEARSIADAPAAPWRSTTTTRPPRRPPLDDDDDDDDDDGDATPRGRDETVLVGSNKHVAKVERRDEARRRRRARALAEHGPPFKRSIYQK